MYLKITKEFEFDSAHFLPNYVGNCHNIHGHTWKLAVTLYGEADSDSGMVLDYKLIKSIVEEEVISKLDHNCLNDIIYNPTSENLIIWISKQLYDKFGGISLYKVKLWESKDSYCEVLL